MSDKKLPEGWKEFELGEVLQYEQPGDYIVDSDEYSDEHETPVLTAGKSFILGYTDEKKGIYTKLPVIIFDDFTTANHFVTFPFKVKSSAMKLLTPKIKNINLKFVFCMMKGLHHNTITHKRYYISEFQPKKIPVPINEEGTPDLNGQEKIIEFIEKAEKAKEWRKEADNLTMDFLKSVFLDMFGDPLSNPKKWDIETLMQVASKDKNSVKRGPFGGSLKKEIFVKDGYKVYEQQNAIYNDMSRGSYYITKEKYNQMIDFSVKPNDFIISCSGTMGKIALIPEDSPKGIINQALLKITLNNSKINNTYFQFFFSSEVLQNHLFSISHGSGISNFPPMNQIRNLPIPLPPVELQNKFASIVKEVEAMKEQQKHSKNHIDKLFNALMQKAFKGELKC